MKIAITGATGQLGSIVVAKLKERTAAENLVALVRTPCKAASLGIETRAFDYTQPEKLAVALSGIDTLLLISSNEIGQREVQHKNVIAAAQKAGIQWIVYTSLLHADTSSLSLAPEHISTEKTLKESGMAYTILRNGWYTENYAVSIPGAIQAGAFMGAAGNGKISSVPREDLAEAAVVVLTSNGHQGKTYELAGDQAYTLTDLAVEISRQTGKTIPYNNLSEAGYAAALIQIGLPASVAAMVSGWDVSASKNNLYDDGKTLSKLLGRPTTPLAEVVKRFLPEIA